MPPKIKKSYLHGYAASLTDSEAKARYSQKLTFIKSLDPYEIPMNEYEDDMSIWPNISYINICFYLLIGQSAYSMELLQNYKSWDSYVFFTNGWVREIAAKSFDDLRLVIAKVLFS